MTAPFWDSARRGTLLVPECESCGRRHWDPEAACPYCGGAWRWETSPGTGNVYSFTVVSRGASPDFEVPYVLALVDLDDGWTIKTNLVDVAEADIAIGMRVRVAFQPLDDEITLPFFAPDPGI